MLKFLSLATGLYKKVQAATPEARERVMAALRESRDCGVVSLGMRKAADGSNEYLWLVFDRTRFTNNAALTMYLRERSPPGMTIAVIEI